MNKHDRHKKQEEPQLEKTMREQPHYAWAYGGRTAEGYRFVHPSPDTMHPMSTPGIRNSVGAIYGDRHLSDSRVLWNTIYICNIR